MREQRGADGVNGKALSASLDLQLPRTIWAGTDNRVFCCGVARGESAIESVELLVDGVAQPIERQVPVAADRTVVRFWSALRVPARDPGAISLRLRARMRGLTAAETLLPGITIESPPSQLRPPAGVGEASIAVCLASYEPEPELLRRQLDSLRAQSDRDWICVISDDCSSLERFRLMENEIGSDPRFAISRADRRLGFYRNFERAIRLAPSDVRLIALCDQDDYWHPDKLSALRAAIGEAPLACSDARLTDPDGRVLSARLWPGRRFDRSSLASGMIANAIPGASMLLRRDVVEMALPFPVVPGWAFHDRWLAAVALARGPVAYVDRPLYDYVQHGGGVLGGWVGKHADAGGRAALGPRPPWLERWRGRCFYAYEPLRAYALALKDRRAAADRRRARVLRRLASAADSPAALAWLAGRLARPLLGRDETGGLERILVTGALWSRMVSAAARVSRSIQTNPPSIEPAALTPPRGRLSASVVATRARVRRELRRPG